MNSISEFGTIGNRNFLSTYLLIFQMLSLSLYIFFKNKRYILYSTIIFAGILSGQTRGVWVSFLLTSFIGFLFIYKNKNQLKKIFVIIACFSLVFLSINITSNGKIFSRFQSLSKDINIVADEIADKSIEDLENITILIINLIVL